jgi:uncharacterized RDD family membrane protein YckC
MDFPDPQPPPLPDSPPRIATAEIVSGAGFWIRFLARFLDMAFGFMLGLATGVIGGILFAVLSRLGRISPDWPLLVRKTSLSGFGLGLLGAFLYHAIAEGVGSVTVGKLICGLRVVQEDGRPATLRGAFIRDLAYHLDALFFGLVGYASMCKGPLQQRYGDVWGKTVVVKAAVFQPTPARSPLRMAAGILVGSVLWAGITFAQLLLRVI